jgi:hypothetical protein
VFQGIKVQKTGKGFAAGNSAKHAGFRGVSVFRRQKKMPPEGGTFLS